MRELVLTMSDKQAVTTTADSTYEIDLGGVSVGNGDDLYWVCRVGTAFANATNMQVSLHAATSSGGSFSSVIDMPTQLEAALTAGAYVACIGLPKGIARHLKTVYTVSGAHNAGTVSSYVTTVRPTIP